MPGLFDAWDAKKERATRPVDPGATLQPPPAPADMDRAARYARAALEGEVANIVAVPIGSGRNTQLNTSAMKMGHYIASGAIDEGTVYAVLGAADGGLDYEDTRKTLRSGIEAGKLTPAVIPRATTPATNRTPAPWETTPAPTPPKELPAWSDPSDPFENPTPPGTVARDGSSDRTGSGSAERAGTSTTPTDSASPGDADPVAPLAGPDSTDPAWRAQVELEARTQRLRRDARRLVDQEDAVREFRVPPSLPSLVDELNVDDDPVTYTVDEVFPTGANVLLTAQFKTGKTTMVNNLIQTLADDEPFLGRFPVHPTPGRIGVFNYEVDGRQYRRWLRDVGVRNPDRVVVLNLRGYRMPLTVPYVETWVVEWLRNAGVTTWIVDPFARAFVGSGDENDNGETGVFLDTLDVIKERAGVSELVMPNHTGRGEMEQGAERGRGATRLDDWADVRWLLTKDKNGARYFRATGRDVEVDEGALTFDPDTRHLTFEAGTRAERTRANIADQVLARLVNVGGQTQTALLAIKGDDKVIKEVIDELIGDGRVRTERGDRNALLHYLGPNAGDARSDPFAPS